MKVVRAEPEADGFDGPAVAWLEHEARVLAHASPAAGAPRLFAQGRVERGALPALAFLVTPRFRPFDPDTPAAQRGRAALEALARLHAHGLVHGDLKPDHVLADGAHAALVDFGAAQLEQPALRPARDAFTPRFAAPERGETGPTRAADVFAWGRTIERWGQAAPAGVLSDEPSIRPTAQELLAALSG